MKIDYKINNFNHKVFIKENIFNYIINDIEELKSDRKILLIYDENIDKKFVHEISSSLRIIGSELIKVETHGSKTKKNEKLLFKILDVLIEKKFTKKSILVSLGGGVIGDVSALAASLYLRGMFFLNIPTTMTSIVDSCLGGKTAINYRNITNSIGGYYHAHSVYISLDIIERIPDREFLAGIPEILKCALIHKNKNFFNYLISNKNKILRRDKKVVKKICCETLKIKLSFFLKDIYEHKKRLFLNFGHTFAHAIEMATDQYKKDFYRHGEAVGLGILCEIFYSSRSKGNLYRMTENFLNSLNLPTTLKFKNKNKSKLQSDIFRFLFLDKKKINKYPRYIFLKSIGKPKIKELRDNTLINESIFNIINN